MIKIAPCLWFDSEAEEAAEFYTRIFPNSKIIGKSHYSDVGKEFHGRPAGSVLTVEFEIDGMKCTALNGGPIFKFNEAVSLQILCDTQEQIDHYWMHLSEGGNPQAQQCGWLKDKFGVSWQVVPTVMEEIMLSGDQKRIDRVMAELFKMKKLNIKQLIEA